MIDLYIHMTEEQQDAVLEALPDTKLAEQILGRRREAASPAWEKYIDKAQEMGRDGELEVDSNAIVSFSNDGGAYVMAWLWVYAKDAKVTKKQQATGLATQA